MTARSILALVVLALLAVPTAQASFELGSGKVLERPLDPGTTQVFEMPLEIADAGYLYAKVLPTEGNAVNDGMRANGSVTEGTGWRATFALVDGAGNATELGTFVDSTMTPLVRVAAGEPWTLRTTLHVPPSAAEGGPRQVVYVAVAFRPSADGSDPGSTSGANIDASRALTLLLTNALLPDVVAPPADEEVDEVVPPVQPIDETGSQSRVVVMQQPLPTWFLVGTILLLGVISLALVTVVVLLARMRRELATFAQRAPAAQAEPRRIPVHTSEEEAARRFLEARALARTQQGPEDE